MNISIPSLLSAALAERPNYSNCQKRQTGQSNSLSSQDEQRGIKEKFKNMRDLVPTAMCLSPFISCTINPLAPLHSQPILHLMHPCVRTLWEAAIRAAERKRLEGDEAPETIEDFERLVHASPNSSFIWIKYMAFLLSSGDENKARSIAERGLQTINFREEGEKLNVWVAYLNLENVYGNPAKEATLQLFQRALQYCDPKKLYMALIGIYERSEQHDMVDELLKTMTQKFKTSTKVWLRRITNFLKRDLPDAAQKALDRALLSLPGHKRIKFISQAALSEYKVGSAERARGMFEGILRNYPKRMDLWSVYLDQELSIGDATVVRALFERATSLELPPKKMKFLFKKYLDFEKSHGSEQRTEFVKAKAMQYVETRLG